MRCAKPVMGMMAALAFLIVQTQPAPAQGAGRAWVSVIKFAGGVAAAYAVHEGAHWAVGQITNTHLEWESGSYNQPIAFTEKGAGDSDGVAVYSAGLIAQVAGSELILNVDRIDKNDAFVRGVMAWNIINPILYALDYWVLHIANDASDDSFQGDLKGVEHYSSKRTANIFAGSIAALAAYQGWRFLKTQSWAPGWIRTDAYQLTFDRTNDGGLCLGVEFAF